MITAAGVATCVVFPPQDGVVMTSDMKATCVLPL